METYSRADPFADEGAQPPVFGTGNSGTGQPETLYDMGAALLEVVRFAAVVRGVPLPSRQLVYPSPIPADCEQVAVLFTGWNPTPMPAPDGTSICHNWRWVAPFSAIITRCTPAIPGKNQGIKTVSSEMMLAASKISSDDSEILVEAMNRIGEIGSDVSIRANPPAGGYQTVELNVSLISGSSFF